MKGAETKKMRV